MGNRPKSRVEIIQEKVETLRSSNLLNDLFASVALEDVGACQYVLRMILDMKDLKVDWVKSQYRLLNLTAKDSILDVYAEDGNGRMMNIELQRWDTVDHARRTRYYSSMLDKSSLDKGLEYAELPDAYIIYISEEDLWGTEETVSHVKKTLGEKSLPYDDGSHVVYVNAAVDDGSEVARMMKYFVTADPDDMSHGELSKRVQYLKKEKGGHEIMQKTVEELVNLGLKEGIELGISQGIEQGDAIRSKKAAINMYQSNMKIDFIARVLETSVAQVEEWLGLVPA
ncbi:MAG: Rpn family recombination-promoting nuclease/putative transposase [Clostridiales bacterium]|nr:Rpn family recombination-promoting nuclease/putative transposase [Clostridiales bacterium]